MAAINNIRLLRGGGLDTDSAPEDVAPNDWIAATNLRNTGTQGQELGYGTNIESLQSIYTDLLAGFTGAVGGGVFEDVGLAMIFLYQSTGKNQILIYNNSTQSISLIYEDLTDSAGIPLLPLLPNMWVTAVLINKTYAIWTATGLEVGHTNLNTLIAGGYGTVLAEDLCLLKPQCAIPPTGTYGSDTGKPANLLFGRLPQFIVQYVNSDFNYSAWSTRSARMAPYQQNTPILGSSVSQNNYIIISVYAGSSRADTLNIACQFDDSEIFSTVKTVTRPYILALTNTTCDVATEVYEAYDPSTNLYSFVFYNNETGIPVTPNETDLLYDYIWLANTSAVLNGNIAALADWILPYARPVIPVSIVAVGYNPNIAIPAPSLSNPLTNLGSYQGASGSGAGDHKRIMYVILGGSPNSGDTITIIQADVRNSSSTQAFIYPVPPAQAGDLASVVASVTAILGTASYVDIGGVYTITFTGQPYFGLQFFGVELFFSGALVANSIPTVLDNTVYTVSFGLWDDKDRPFPITTDNTYIVNTPSKAEVNGQAIQIAVNITNAPAPAGAAYFIPMITKAPIIKVLETTATTLTYKGPWDAAANSPTLAVNSGNIGDTYQITTPATPAVPGTYHNLGNGDAYPTGDYITVTGGTASGAGAGTSFSVLDKSFGDLTTTGSIMAFSLNPLNLFNSQYSNQGVSTILGYDFAPGDRCTLQYVIIPVGVINMTTITPGSGYTDDVYPNVALTGGTGSGAIANVTVSGGMVTSVVFVSGGINYSAGDVLTGTVAGGTGWSLTVNTLYMVGINYFNAPCIDLAVLGYDAGTYIVKLEKSAALTYTNGHIYYNGIQLDGYNVFLRLYSPAPLESTQAEQEWYELGQRYTITNGQFDVTQFLITDGGWYYKTRQFADAPMPYTNPPIEVLATDANYSDFYTSAFSSFGRARTFYDVLESTEQAASIITSQPYITGSRVNGLNRMYPELIYGESDGQSSSSHGAIQIMWPHGQQLVLVQGNNTGYIPVNEAYTVLNDQLTGQSISSKLLNNIRYSTEGIGIGTNKESFWTRFSRGGFISPYINEPVEIGDNGVVTISGKNSKYFKTLISAAVALGKRMMQYYDTYYEEVILAVQSQSGIIYAFPFGAAWNPSNSYVIAPGAFTSVDNGSHSTVAYDTVAGTATYDPSTNYVGTDTASFSFNPGSGVITVNNCLQWLAGVTTVDTFIFNPQFGVPLSTEIQSNSILVNGNNVPVAISITGGQYSINGGAFTSSPGLVNPLDSVVVEVMSSASNSTAASCTLTISGTSNTFTATTRALGNFTVDAQYGMTITGISNSTSTGVPAGLASINVTPGNSLAIAYSSVTAGNMILTVTGTPAIPGHVRANCYVNSVSIGTVLITGGGDYVLPIGNSTDPTPILVAIETFS